MTLVLEKLGRMQRSGIDTIKYHTLPRTPYGKVTKTQGTITHKRTKRSALSQQVITRLQGTDGTVLQRQRQTPITKWIHKRSTALEQSVKILEGLNMFNGTNFTLNTDVYKDT